MRQDTIMRSLVLSGLFLACGAFAETDPPPAFEAASIKTNNSINGGSHTRTRPAYLQAENVSLRNLITMAYKLRDYELTGPDWLRNERFDILAKAKFGTPVDALRPMLQTFRADRF